MEKVGLLIAGLLMLGGAFLPCIEIMGESSSAFHLATLGMGVPWLWLLVSAPLLMAVAVLSRSNRLKVSIALAAGLGPLMGLLIAWNRFGPIVWQILRPGAFLLLLGALVSLLSAFAIVTTPRRELR